MVLAANRIMTLAVFFLMIGHVVATEAEIDEVVAGYDVAGDVDRDVDQGEIFYLNYVLPKLSENGCLKCHARGYIRPTISYESMFRRLAIGDSAENNVVIYKIANVRSFSQQIPNHPGGQRCATIDAEPCKSIRQWWEIEFGLHRTDK